jgi:hypothetical protein
MASTLDLKIEINVAGHDDIEFFYKNADVLKSHGFVTYNGKWDYLWARKVMTGIKLEGNKYKFGMEEMDVTLSKSEIGGQKLCVRTELGDGAIKSCTQVIQGQEQILIYDTSNGQHWDIDGVITFTVRD